MEITGDKSREVTNVTIELLDSIFEHNGCNDTYQKYTEFEGGTHLTFYYICKDLV